MRTASAGRFSAYVLAAGLVLSSPPADAAPIDRLELVTGEVFYGTILRRNEDEVSIQLGSGGIISFQTARIREVRQRGVRHSPEREREDRVPAVPEPPVDWNEPPAPEAPRRVDMRRIPVVRVPDGEAGATGEADGKARDGANGHATGEPPVPGAAAGDGAVPGGTGSGGTADAPSSPATTPARPPRDGPGAKPGSPDPQRTATREPVVDSVRGFSVTPPPGFAAVEREGASGNAVRTFRHPLTGATFQIAAYLTDEPLVEIKKRVTAAYTERFRAFRVIEDGPFAGKGFEGWRVEVAAELGSVPVQKLQLFARSGERVLLLTCSAAGGSWTKHAAAFHETLQSFRVTAPARGR